MFQDTAKHIKINHHFSIDNFILKRYLSSSVQMTIKMVSNSLGGCWTRYIASLVHMRYIIQGSIKWPVMV